MQHVSERLSRWIHSFPEPRTAERFQSQIRGRTDPKCSGQVHFRLAPTSFSCLVVLGVRYQLLPGGPLKHPRILANQNFCSVCVEVGSGGMMSATHMASSLHSSVAWSLLLLHRIFLAGLSLSATGWAFPPTLQHNLGFCRYHQVSVSADCDTMFSISYFILRVSTAALHLHMYDELKFDRNAMLFCALLCYPRRVLCIPSSLTIIYSDRRQDIIIIFPALILRLPSVYSRRPSHAVFIKVGQKSQSLT
ncbi:hypothetical protein B0H12DRAFT_779525 [Mycena haematopus]|nr:hypothetical protein B0H12DRAFT_779525 [Mycena haematopus]